MKSINWVLIVITGFFISSVVQAAPARSDLIDTKAFNDQQSPLPAGSRVVAGDLKKNEFFILPGSDKTAINLAENKSEAKPVSTDADTSIKVAVVKKPISPTGQTDVSHIKLALDRALHHANGKPVAVASAAKVQPSHMRAARKLHKSKIHQAKNSKSHHSKAQHLASNSKAHKSAKQTKLGANVHHTKVKKAQVRA